MFLIKEITLKNASLKFYKNPKLPFFLKKSLESLYRPTKEKETFVS